MTDATNTPQTTADRSPLEGIIRDLYALVAFYLAHPAHPLPTHIQVSHRVADIETVEAVAEQFGHHVYGDVPQTHHDLLDTGPVDITMIVSMPNRPERPL